MTGGFGAFTAGSKEGDDEPVQRRKDDGPGQAAASFDCAPIEYRPNTTTSNTVDQMRPRPPLGSMGEIVSPSTETDSNDRPLTSARATRH